MCRTYTNQGFIHERKGIKEDQNIPAYEIVNTETKRVRRDMEPQISCFEKMFTPKQFAYLKSLPDYEDRIQSCYKDSYGKVWVSVKTVVKIFPEENINYWKRYSLTNKNLDTSYVEFDLNYFFKSDSKELRRLFFKFKEFLNREINLNMN